MEFRWVLFTGRYMAIDSSRVDVRDAKTVLGISEKVRLCGSNEIVDGWKDKTDCAIRLIDERKQRERLARLEPSEGEWEWLYDPEVYKLILGDNGGIAAVSVFLHEGRLTAESARSIDEMCLSNAGNLYRALRDIDPEHELVRKIQQEAGG